MPFLYVLTVLVIVGILAWAVNVRFPLDSSIRGILNVVMGLIVIGILLWAVNTYVPMAGAIRALLNIVVVLASVVWVLRAFGLWGQVVRIWNNLTSRRISNERTVVNPGPTDVR
jgi:hypothetical protein